MERKKTGPKQENKVIPMVQEEIKSKRMKIPDWFPRVEESKYHSESFCTEQGGCKNMTHAGRGRGKLYQNWERLKLAVRPRAIGTN